MHAYKRESHLGASILSFLSTLIQILHLTMYKFPFPPIKNSTHGSLQFIVLEQRFNYAISSPMTTYKCTNDYFFYTQLDFALEKRRKKGDCKTLINCYEKSITLTKGLTIVHGSKVFGSYNPLIKFH